MPSRLNWQITPNGLLNSKMRPIWIPDYLKPIFYRVSPCRAC